MRWGDRWCWRGLLFVVLVLLEPWPVAQAAGRVALVIGNASYAERPLRNPPNDARAIAALLRKLGFAVTEKTDLDLSGFRAQVNAFLDQSRGADLRLFFYSGHGASYDGDNYLLPINHGVTRKHELPDQAYSLKTLLRGFKDLSGVNLVLLDSCRNAPFGDDKSIWDDSKGMKPIQPQEGVLIGYAAQNGRTASDNSGGSNSLYTKYLLRELGQALELREALMRVRQAVYDESRGEQRPTTEDEVLGKVYLAAADAPRELPSVTTGTLVVRSSQPPGAVLSVDGKRLGAAPQTVTLKAGEHTIEAKQAGFIDYRDAVQVRAGEQTVLNVVLTAAPREPAPVERSRQAFEPELVSITGGCFQMGSPESEEGRQPWEPNERQHRVCVKDFALGQNEVTVGEFRRFVAAMNYRTDAEKNAAGKEGCYAWSATDNASDWRAGLSWRKPGYEQKDSHPVVCVSWNDANRYAEWLSQETGQSYRLPSEAEWEYAARAGMMTARHWGEDPNQACRYANVADQTKGPENKVWTEKHDCSDGYWYTAPVGSFQPNAWKLYDMLGNVWEWTCSAYDKEYGGSEAKCTEKGTTGPLAVRGGAWNIKPARVRSAGRLRNDPTTRNNNQGFRLARSL